MAEWIGGSIILLGCLMALLGVVGSYRMKDSLSRAQALSLVDTAAPIIVCMGAIVTVGWSFMAFQYFLIFFLLMLFNPLTTHFICKAYDRVTQTVKKD